MFRTLFLLLIAIAPPALRAAIINVPADQPSIQAGINAANPGDTVLVAPGTYYENINFNGKVITVTSSGGAAVTIIDGSAKAPVVTFAGAETRASVLSNLTLRNGGINGIAWGGIYNVQPSSPTILNNLILQNACNGYSGSGSALLQGNTISGTTYSSSGGCPSSLGAGILIYAGSPPFASVIGNIIENNVQPAQFNAAGLVLTDAGTPIIENNIIRNNGMTGVYVANMNNLLFIQNLVYGNTSQNAPGGMYMLVPFVVPGPVAGVIANNTFVGNKALSPSASQVFLDASLSQFDFVNNIVIGSDSNAAFFCGYPPADALSLTPLVIDHNDIYNPSGPAYGNNCPDQTGTYGNISADPLFTNPATANFHLTSGSPAIDAGNNSVLGLPSKDFVGNPRLQDATSKLYPIVDMGAYEFPGLADANATTIVLTPSSYHVSAGIPITLAANLLSVNGIPTGAVTFFEDTSTLGSSTIDASGTASFSTAGLTPGIHAFVATYPGQSTFTPAVAIKIFVLVDVYVPALTLTSTPNPSHQNQPVTFTAVVSPFASPVVFTDTTNSTTLATLTPNSAGVATFTTSTLAIGNHVITAKYPGDPSHSAASASVNQQILPPLVNTTTLLTSTPNPANALQPVTLTASVSTGTTTIATGTVTFFDGGTALGTATLDATGHATFITSTLTTGTHTINAVYSGDTSFATSTSNNIAETITANPTFTTLSISPTQSQAFQFFTVTVSVSSLTSVPFSTQSCTPACTVTLTITGLPNNQNSTVTAPILANGTAPFKYALAVGTYTFSATFNGSSAFSASTSGILSETVVPAATTLTLAAAPTTANQSQAVAFTSVFTAPLSTEVPSGTITFLDGATPFATTPFTGNPLSNTTTINAATASLFVGTHIITATYSGSPNFLPITSAPVTVVINADDFTLATSTPNPAIPTEHHLAIPVNLSSLGVFADQVTLACTNLPVWTTCTFDQNTLQLTASGTATTNLTIDTSSVLRYARNQNPSTSPIVAKSIAFALTLPAGILGLFLTRRRRLPLRLTLFFLTTLAATLTLTGCSGMYPLSTPPGTYTFNIIARGTTTNIAHTLPITLTVTP